MNDIRACSEELYSTQTPPWFVRSEYWFFRVRAVSTNLKPGGAQVIEVRTQRRRAKFYKRRYIYVQRGTGDPVLDSGRLNVAH